MSRQSYLRLFAGLLVLMSHPTEPAMAQVGMKLEISGRIDAAALSLKDLEVMQQMTFGTTTIWTDGVRTFAGVPLKARIDAGYAAGDAVEMVALNDYVVTMPIAEIDEDAPIIATRMNGDLMSIRNKGSFGMVFPDDSDPKYQSETIYSHSIWQLNRFMVVNE